MRASMNSGATFLNRIPLFSGVAPETLVRLDPVNRYVGIDVVGFDDVRRVIKGVLIAPAAVARPT
jgi:hypothetical protein